MRTESIEENLALLARIFEATDDPERAAAYLEHLEAPDAMPADAP